MSPIYNCPVICQLFSCSRRKPIVCILLGSLLQNNIIICLNTTCKNVGAHFLAVFNLLSVKMIRKCTSADDDCGKKRQKTMQPHLIKADWFVRFAWLIHDSESHDLCCKVCVHAKAKNVFVTGKDCAKTQDLFRLDADRVDASEAFI